MPDEAPSVPSPPTRAVVAWAFVTALAAFASTAAVVAQARVLRSSAPALSDALRADHLALRTGSVFSAAVAVSALLLAWWTYRAFRRAESLKTPGLAVSAARAAWEVVLPVVQVWRPFVALGGLGRALEHAIVERAEPRADASDTSAHYRESAAAKNTPSRMPRVVLGGPWALWWAGHGLSYTAAWMRARAATPAGLLPGLYLDLASQLALGVAALFVARSVWALHVRLDALAARGVRDA
jgi:hypothetical protein